MWITGDGDEDDAADERKNIFFSQSWHVKLNSVFERCFR